MPIPISAGARYSVQSPDMTHNTPTGELCLQPLDDVLRLSWEHMHWFIGELIVRENWSDLAILNKEPFTFYEFR